MVLLDKLLKSLRIEFEASNIYLWVRKSMVEKISDNNWLNNQIIIVIIVIIVLPFLRNLNGAGERKGNMCDYVKLQWHLKNAFAGIRLTSCQTTLKSLDGTNFYYFNVFRLQLFGAASSRSIFLNASFCLRLCICASNIVQQIRLEE